MQHEYKMGIILFTPLTGHLPFGLLILFEANSAKLSTQTAMDPNSVQALIPDTQAILPCYTYLDSFSMGCANLVNHVIQCRHVNGARYIVEDVRASPSIQRP